jgi:hypothetical protein
MKIYDKKAHTNSALSSRLDGGKRWWYDYTSNNWSQWNCNEMLKEKFGKYIRQTFDRFTTKGSYTWIITHNTESTAVLSLKLEGWGSLLVQEKYQEEKALHLHFHTNPISIY